MAATTTATVSTAFGGGEGSVRRRAVSVPALLLAAVVLTLLLPLWLPLAALADVVRLRFRLPIARLLAFGLCWSWLELAGVSGAGVLWLLGQSRNTDRHFALQRWWASNLMRALQATTGISIAAETVGDAAGRTGAAAAFTPGPVVVLCRHASLADSLVSAYVITSLARMKPRYVLKRELLADPCLDIVGRRLPNHFLDRGANDSAPELAALRAIATGMGAEDCAVIFPEGTRANPTKRTKAMERIAERDPERAQRLGAITTLLPPRPAGAQALLQGAPDADVVLCWHVGFDGLDTFGGILRHLSRRMRPVQFVARRVSRSTLPPVDDTLAFTRWLDDRWCELDAEATAALAATQETHR